MANNTLSSKPFWLMPRHLDVSQLSPRVPPRECREPTLSLNTLTSGRYTSSIKISFDHDIWTFSSFYQSGFSRVGWENSLFYICHDWIYPWGLTNVVYMHYYILWSFNSWNLQCSWTKEWLTLEPLVLASLESMSVWLFYFYDTYRTLNILNISKSSVAILKYICSNVSLACDSPLIWEMTSWLSVLSLIFSTPISPANVIPIINASYSAWFLVEENLNCKETSTMRPTPFSRIMPTPLT